jgi:hypothetical protein
VTEILWGTERGNGEERKEKRREKRKKKRCVVICNANVVVESVRGGRRRD